MSAGTDLECTWRSLRYYVNADRRANLRDPKAQGMLLFFRFCQALISTRSLPNFVVALFVLAYRLLTEFVLGVELRPKTRVGPGLSVYHGFGLVVNDQAVIGCNVKLRNSVTIGHKRAGGGVPTIGNNVEIGAGAILLGDIYVGSDSTIGAGAVVLQDVPAGSTVAGNPARIIKSAGRQ